MPKCRHYSAARLLDVPDGVAGCEACLASGDTWVHLRMCLECGHVGCCDSSVNRHARRHHETTGHQLIRSAESGETWAYCYAHEQYTNLART